MSYKIFRNLQYLLLVGVLLSACKKDKKNPDPKGGGPSEDPAVNISTMMNTSGGATLKYQEALEAGGDSVDAFLAMGQWLLQQPNVEKVTVMGLSIMNVYYNSGLQSIINIQNMAADGTAYTRGGGNGSGGSSSRAGMAFRNLARTTADNYVIGNKKVLILSPYDNEFYNNGYPFLNKFQTGKHKLEVKYIKETDVTLSTLNSMQDYGLIILNTHGLPQGFQIRHKVQELDLPHDAGSNIYTDKLVRDMFSDANGLPMDRVINGDLIMTIIIYQYDNNPKKVFVSEKITVTDKYVRTLPALNKAVVFGNYCFSGWTAPNSMAGNMAQAFKSIGAISYYGYAYLDGTSAPVFNPFAKAMEDTLITSLTNGDSTGLAHLENNDLLQTSIAEERMQPEEIALTIDMTRGGLTFQVTKEPDPQGNEPLFFLHYDDKRYSYNECGTITDKRDGEVYQVACIGDQQWMAENLRYNASGSVALDNDNSTVAKLGRLYKFMTVTDGAGISAQTGPGPRGICPEGWHLPSKEDYDKLVANLNKLGPANEHGVMLKSKKGWDEPSQDENHPRRNLTGFNALPVGIGKDAAAGLMFFYQGERLEIWATSRLDNVTKPNTTGMISLVQYGIHLDATFNELGPGMNADITYHSCRCVKD